MSDENFSICLKDLSEPRLYRYLVQSHKEQILCETLGLDSTFSNIVDGFLKPNTPTLNDLEDEIIKRHGLEVGGLSFEEAKEDYELYEVRWKESFWIKALNEARADLQRIFSKALNADRGI